MLHLVAALRTSIRQRNSYAALTLALTLPDVASSLELESSERRMSTGRYIAWWDRWALPYFSMSIGGEVSVFVGGGDAYALRCAVLHEGSDDTSRQRASVAIERFIFQDAAEGDTSHLIRFGSTVYLDVYQFCESVAVSVEDWAREVRDRSGAVQRRSLQLMKVRRASHMHNGMRFG